MPWLSYLLPFCRLSRRHPDALSRSIDLYRRAFSTPAGFLLRCCCLHADLGNGNIMKTWLGKQSKALRVLAHRKDNI